MRRTVLFLSRFLLGIWIILVGAFLSLLLSNAPSVPENTPFASVSIQAGQISAIHLPNRIFTCSETAQRFQCQTQIQDRLLDLNFTKGSDYKYDFSHCSASYDSRSVGCREMGMNYAPILSLAYEIEERRLDRSSEAVKYSLFLFLYGWGSVWTCRRKTIVMVRKCYVS